jgi:transcriptional regulator of acetoin/glycerol metabolism
MTQGSTILLEHLPEHIHNQKTKSIPTGNHKSFNLRALEKDTIERALSHYSGNITRTSKALGIGRNTLYDKMNKYGLK